MEEGTVLNNRYQLLERLGTGGMSDVFRARDLMLERTVAIKVLHEKSSDDKAFQERFRMEVGASRIWVQLGQPPKMSHSLTQSSPAQTEKIHIRCINRQSHWTISISPDLRGVTLGVFTPWFEHASPAIVEGCRKLLNDFQSLGASIREIVIPELDAARVAHVVTISSEMNAALAQFYDTHHADYGLDVRTNLSLARTFNSHDYIHAQQIRTRTIAHFQKAFDQVDAIITIPNDRILQIIDRKTSLVPHMFRRAHPVRARP